MTPKRFCFVLLGLLALGLAGSSAGYYWAIGQINTSSSQIRSQLADQQQNDDTLTKLEQAKTQYARQIVPILPTLTAVLPATKNQTEILIQLQTLAKQSGLFITSVSFPSALGLPSQTSQTSVAGSALALPISFQVSGKYDQLQAFLTSIESLNRLSTITSLAISHPAAGDLMILSYAITLNTFIKP